MNWPPRTFGDWAFLALLAVLIGVGRGVGHAAATAWLGP